MQAAAHSNVTAEIHRLPGDGPAMVEPSALHAWLEDKSVFLIDVREPHEFERERIAGAFLVPMSRFDADTFPHMPGLKTVLVSEQGPRSLALVERLADNGFGEVYGLEGGLAAWRAAGFELDE
jgi:rhodanese-related sulfurtransferase